MYARTTNGCWWSATRSTTTNANYLETNTGYVRPQYSYGRGDGFAVGCVISTPNYNQLNLWPLQFLRTGDYIRSTGTLNGRTTHSYWWSNTSGESVIDARDLSAWTGLVGAQYGGLSGYGFALRWVGDKNELVKRLQVGAENNRGKE